MKIFMRGLMLLYLLVLVALWLCTHFDAGNSWWLSLWLFSPRWVLGLPWLLLVPLTWWLQPSLAKWYALHLLILVIPLGGLCLPALAWKGQSVSLEQTRQPLRLRLLTCNMGEGPIDNRRIVDLIQQQNSDVVCLQEANPAIVEELQALLPWNFKYESGLVIGSPHPIGDVTVLARYGPAYWNVAVGIAADITLTATETIANQPPLTADRNSGKNSIAGKVRVASIHFATFRPAFEKARNFDASAKVEYFHVAKLYRGLAAETQAALQTSTLPLVCGGDFNVPVESAFYKNYWSGYQNALSQVGFGWCYTKYTRWHGVRIDHVLTDSQWTIDAAHVGPDLGGDHRPVLVEMSLR